MAFLPTYRLPPAPPAERIAVAVQALYGASPALSLVMAEGGLHKRVSAVAVARRWRLVAEVETQQARERGLLR